MKRRLILLAVVAGLAACQHRDEPNKLIDGIPVNIGATVVPVQATQQYLFLKRDLLTVTIPVINKVVNADSTFPELTSIGGGAYQFNGIDGHYGNAIFTITFRDNNSAAIDPIAVRSSSSSLKAIVATVTGSSSLFTYSENLVLQLDTAGVLDSTRRLSGTSTFTGINAASTYSLSFDMPTTVAIFEGIFSGHASATGTGGTPAQPTELALDFATNRSLNGTVKWEGNSGTYHIDITGPAYVVTGQTRIFID